MPRSAPLHSPEVAAPASPKAAAVPDNAIVVDFVAPAAAQFIPPAEVRLPVSAASLPFKSKPAPHPLASTSTIELHTPIPGSTSPPPPDPEASPAAPETAAPQAEDEQIEFDEAEYLRLNPDLARLHRDGRLPSPREHYLKSGRFAGRLARLPKSPAAQRHEGAYFLTPADLTATVVPLKRVALIGSCLLQAWGFHKKNPSDCPADFLTLNNADGLPDSLAPGVVPSDYDFQVIQIPIRALVPDTALTSLDYNSVERYWETFEKICERLAFHLKCRMEWNEKYGLLTFVCNFFVPQRNPMGVLFPRFDIRNPEHFTNLLNEKLEEMVRAYKNAYVLDQDRIAASIGRRYVQDDSVIHFSHGALLFLTPPTTTRIEPLEGMASHYDIRWPTEFLEAIWAELISMYRVVRQADSVKMVVVDLDDTLWHGISGDLAEIGPHMIEGWPIGLVEALLYLKKRGVLLAVISRNEETRIREIWPKIFRTRISLDDFAAVFINWGPKTENMRQLLEAVNLLPRSVVFIDDNPAERDAMAQAFPEIRILGRNPYYLRRILLWSAETQVPMLTKESARRTAMVQKQVLREANRKQMSREDFLREAAPAVALDTLAGADDKRFDRVLELINKTNQFNTTGRRWTSDQLARDLARGTVCFVFEVSDKYTDYGLVGAILVRGTLIEQWVMSCRILGYQIEQAVMAKIVQSIRAHGPDEIGGRLEHTEVNFPARTLFANCGFSEQDGCWLLPRHREVAMPGHVRIAETPNQPSPAVLQPASPLPEQRVRADLDRVGSASYILHARP